MLDCKTSYILLTITWYAKSYKTDFFLSPGNCVGLLISMHWCRQKSFIYMHFHYYVFNKAVICSQLERLYSPMTTIASHRLFAPYLCSFSHLNTHGKGENDISKGFPPDTWFILIETSLLYIFRLIRSYKQQYRLDHIEKVYVGSAFFLKYLVFYVHDCKWSTTLQLLTIYWLKNIAQNVAPIRYNISFRPPPFITSLYSPFSASFSFSSPQRFVLTPYSSSTSPFSRDLCLTARLSWRFNPNYLLVERLGGISKLKFTL